MNSSNIAQWRNHRMQSKPTKLLCYFSIGLLTLALEARACPLCASDSGVAIRTGIRDGHFLLVLMSISSIFLSFAAIVLIGSRLFTRKMIFQAQFGNKLYTDPVYLNSLCLLMRAGLLLGGSIVGFCDGILFHQILQLHSMIANQKPLNSLVNIQINMFWDGIFDAGSLMMMLFAIVLLWLFHHHHPSKFYQPTTLLSGSIFLGAGLFNLLEGSIDHQLLQLHHVIQQTTPAIQLYADLGFLGVALLLMAIGILWMRRSFYKGAY